MTPKLEANNPQRPTGVVRCVCGSTLFRRCYRTGGWWKQLVESKPDGSMEVIDTDTDSVRSHREPKTMECTGCGKRVANPDAAPNDKVQTRRD